MIESLNQVFQLRDCPDRTKFEFSIQQLLFGERQTASCIRHELGSCPAPCAGHCSAHEYQTNVEQLLNFLDGKSPQLLKSLETKMHEAATTAAFERAAIIRDYWKQLTWLDRRLTGLRLAHKNLNGVLPVKARRNRIAWIILKGGRIVQTVKRPDDPAAASKLLPQIQKITRCETELPTNVLEMNLQLIVISWLRKNPQLKKQIISFPNAIDYLQQIEALALSPPSC